MLDRPKEDKTDRPMLSRLEKLRKQLKNPDYEPEMPPVQARQLLDYLYEIGPVLSGGMGPVLLSHTEIASWQHNTGIELTPWEARTLRALSLAYLSMADKATDVKCQAPWAEAEEVVATQNRASDEMKNHIRRMAGL